MSSALLMAYLSQYTYLGLFFILGISIMGLPTPDEFLMTFVGFLSYSGKVNHILAIVSATAGSMTGITITYFLGRFFGGKILVFLKKHVGSDLLEKVIKWDEKHGGKLLTVGYFIPGVRHLSGYISGFSGLEYRTFAFYAYLGALLWTSSFISLGRILGTRWKVVLPIVHRYSIFLAIIGTVLSLAFYLLYKNHKRWGAWVVAKLSRMPARYQSLGRRRAFFILGGATFVVLFVFLMGLIQDFVANEVGEFDELIFSGVELITLPSVSIGMRYINALGTHGAILIVFILSALLLKKRTQYWTHMRPLALAWAGGTLIDYLFRVLFRGENINVFENIVPFQASSTGFQLAALSFYAVLGYLCVRESSRPAQILMLIAEVVLLIILGLSPVFLRIHVPSTMLAAITVSCLWALICLFIYEFRTYQEEPV